jgi:hypothetical protein
VQVLALLISPRFSPPTIAALGPAASQTIPQLITAPNASLTAPGKSLAAQHPTFSAFIPVYSHICGATAKIALAKVSTTIQSKYLPTKSSFNNIRGDYVTETRKRNKYDYA